MEAPDKVYIQDYNIPEYGFSTTWTTDKVENDAVHSVEYVRAERLTEWLKEHRDTCMTMGDDTDDRFFYGLAAAYSAVKDLIESIK